MAIVKDFELRGVEQMVRNLERFGSRIEKGATKKAVEAGAEIIEKGFIQDAPVETGHLKRNIGKRFRKYRHVQYAVIGGKSLRSQPKRLNSGIYAYILQWRKNVQKSHYLWASKSFEKNRNQAKERILSELKLAVTNASQGLVK